MDAPALEDAADGYRVTDMHLKKRTLIIITAAIIAVIALSLHLSLQERGKARTELVPAIPEQALEKFSITETEGGKPHWVLEASSAQILESQKKVLLQLPVVKFYEKGEYVSTLVAASGRINTETYDIWGEGKCTLTTTKGERLETSNLRYRADQKKILTDEQVTLVRADETIYGKGMEASPDLSLIKIRSQRVELKGTRKP